jgi:hypothetical protein
MVGFTLNTLNLTPKSLRDSAATPAERERVAAARVEDYLDKLLANQVRYVEVPPQLHGVLRERYDAKVNEAGVDRAFERAQRVRATLDSTRATRPQPPTARPGAGTSPSLVAPKAPPPAAVETTPSRPATPTPAPTKRP